MWTDWLTLTLRSLHLRQPDRDLPLDALVLATGWPLISLVNFDPDMLGVLANLVSGIAWARIYVVALSSKNRGCSVDCLRMRYFTINIDHDTSKRTGEGQIGKRHAWWRSRQSIIHFSWRYEIACANKETYEVCSTGGYFAIVALLQFKRSHTTALKTDAVCIRTHSHRSGQSSGPNPSTTPGSNELDRPWLLPSYGWLRDTNLSESQNPLLW